MRSAELLHLIAQTCQNMLIEILHRTPPLLNCFFSKSESRAIMVLGISKLSRKPINLSVLPNSEPRNDNARSQNRQKAGPSGSSPLIAALRRATTPRLALKDQARKVLALLRSRRPKSTPHLSKGPRAAARASGGTTGASSHSRILPLLPVGSHVKPCRGCCTQAEAARALLDLGASPLLNAADGTSLLACTES